MKTSLLKFIVAAAFIAAAIFSFTACNPLKKAQGIARQQPKEFVDIIREQFPCVPGTLPDTTARSDSSAYAQSIALLQDYINESSAYYDSVLNAKTGELCDTANLWGVIKLQADIISTLNKKIVRIPAIHDTIPKPYPVKDMAEIQAKQNTIDDLVTVSNALIKEKDDALNDIERLQRFKRITIISLILLLVGTAIGIYLKKYVFAGKTISSIVNLGKKST